MENQSLLAPEIGTFPATFCPLVWRQLTVMPQGRIKPCCTALPLRDSERNPIYFVNQDEDLNLSWNREELKAVRRTMMAGQWPDHCRDCANAEANGLVSKRQKISSHWRDLSDLKARLTSTRADGHLEMVPVALDLRLGNVCNLSCIMCHPGASTSWSKVHRQVLTHVDSLGLRSSRFLYHFSETSGQTERWPDDERILPWIRSLAPTLREIQLAGGEPLLLKSHQRMLLELVESGESKHIVLKYNSNGTHLPDEILELWTHFETVNLYLSIDGVGDEYSYIRTPARWEDLAVNIDRYLCKKQPHWNLLFIYSLQFLNCHSVMNFVSWCATLTERRCLHRKAESVVWNVVGTPSCLSPQALPANVKQEILAKVDQEIADFWDANPQWRNDPVISELPKMLRSAMSFGRGFRTAPIAETLNYLQILDQIHRQDWRKVFPWLSSRIGVPTKTHPKLDAVLK